MRSGILLLGLMLAACVPVHERMQKANEQIVLNTQKARPLVTQALLDQCVADAEALRGGFVYQLTYKAVGKPQESRTAACLAKLADNQFFRDKYLPYNSDGIYYAVPLRLKGHRLNGTVDKRVTPAICIFSFDEKGSLKFNGATRVANLNKLAPDYCEFPGDPLQFRTVNRRR